ncbi:MAG: indolepyruvate oxidoreductase subunit beta [Lachnospiraceae bacterium]|nr:indolepyruvate oxidoreductase subunit beta [Lachnospiraceae bacterium]
MSYNILLCGVGGQGTVLASKLLAASAMENNETVHSAETIGMAQRGGPVSSHVRIGEDVYSPLIPKHSADLLIAFEPSEAVRNLDFLKDGGAVIVNEIPMMPVTESLQPTGYNGREMIRFLKQKIQKLAVVNADELCAPLGSSKFFNVAVLGVALGARFLHFEEETVKNTIAKTVKEKFVESNIKAFEIGKEVGLSMKPDFDALDNVVPKREMTEEERNKIIALEEQIQTAKERRYETKQ